VPRSCVYFAMGFSLLADLDEPPTHAERKGALIK
jgi:hypothetical protein